MNRILLAIIASVGLTACASNTPQLDPRAIARGTVETLEAAWIATAQACIEVSKTQQSPSTLQQCEKVLTPARDSLIAAAEAVDAWDARAQGNFPCLIQDAVSGLTSIRNLVADTGVKLPQVVDDGLALAAMFLPQCQANSEVDGGAT